MDPRKRADQIFREVCDLSPAEQRAALSERCGDDVPLREEVEALLGADAEWSEGGPNPLSSVDRYKLLGEAFDRNECAAEPELESVGPFTVKRLIGRGGMGMVYEAEDTKLDRRVALKVLPQKSLLDAERRRRFEREAKVLASLNHPNVATIYGIEETDGRDVLVLELVEGEDLRERLARGPMPLEEALEVCAQIAEGLAAAHDAGVIHRDLKPANIKLGPEGTVKILDFGIAKRFIAKPAADSQPSLAIQETAAGAVIGTVSYMSPEQARGQAVDRRTDIWALGCVLYEALTGQRTFDGETNSDVLAAVIERQPDWEALPPDTPPGVRRLLRRCLEKAASRRLRDAGDARLEIRECLEATTGSVGASDAVGEQALRSALRVPVLILLAALFGAAVSAVVILSLLRPPPELAPSAKVRRVSVVLPEGAEPALARFTERGIGRPSIALSPDGRRLAYVARSDEAVRLYVHDLDAWDARRLPGTEGAFNPFFSPDGMSMAFFADGALKTISILGGQPVRVCEALNPNGGAWGADDTIVFAGYGGESLWRVAARGGQPEVIATPGDLTAPGRSWMWPSFLPDGDAVLFSRVGGGLDASRVRVLGSGEEKVLLEGVSTGVKYIPTGHLLFARGGVLMAAPFELDKLRVTGDAVPVIEGLRIEARGAVQYSVSQDGTLAYLPGRPMNEGRLVWRGRAKDDRPVEAWPGYRNYGTFKLSPDGSTLAVSVREPAVHIWVYHEADGRQERLTSAGDNMLVVWIDNKRIVYWSRQKDGVGVFSRRANGSGTAKPILSGVNAGPYSFSKKNQVVLVNKEKDIWALPLDTGKLEPVVSTPDIEWGPSFSPDGKWIVYTREAGGHSEVYLGPYPGPRTDRKLSTDGGEEPIWSPKGDEIFYRNGDRWMVVRVTLEPEFEVLSPPELLFTGNFLNIGGFSYDYDPHHDRFLLVEPHKEAPAREIRLVLDWFEEVRRLVPSGAE